MNEGATVLDGGAVGSSGAQPTPSLNLVPAGQSSTTSGLHTVPSYTVPGGQYTSPLNHVAVGVAVFSGRFASDSAGAALHPASRRTIERRTR